MAGITSQRRVRALALCAVLYCGVLFGFVSAVRVFSLKTACIITVSAASAAALVLLLVRKPLYCPAALLLGCASLGLFIHSTCLPARAFSEAEGVFVLRADGRAEERYGTASLDATLLEFDGKKTASLKVRLLLSDASPPAYQAGDRITVTAEASLTESLRRMSDGSFVTVRQSGSISVLPLGADTAASKIRRFSAAAGDRIMQLLPSREGALLCAMITGERGYFDRDFENALAGSGLAHISAVSGLHVSVITACLMFVLGKRGGIAASFAVLPVYAVMTGLSPSVLRAVIMGGMLSAAFLLKSEYDPLTALAVAAAILSSSNPFVIFSASFLLSFCSTLGIVTVGIRLSYYLQVRLSVRNFLRHAVAKLAAVFAVSVAALTFTLPLQLIFFPSVSSVSIVSNMLAVWAVPVTMFAGMLLVPLCALLPAASGVLSFAVSLPLRYLVWVIELMGDTLSLTARSDNLFLHAAAAGLVIVSLLYHSGRINGIFCTKIFLTLLTVCLCCSALMPDNSLYLWGENGVSSAVLTSQHKTYAVNAPTGYSGQTFTSSRLSGLKAETLILTDPDYRASGNAGNINAKRVFSPAPVDVQTEVYTESGFLSLGKVRAELIWVDGTAILRLKTPKYCLLDLSAVSPYADLPELARCDGLIIDSEWAGAGAILRYVCARCTPSAVFVSGSADAEETEAFCGCKVVCLDDCQWVKVY